MNGRVMVNPFFLTKDYKALEHTSVKVWVNYWRLESGSLNGGTASLPEFVLGKLNYRNVDHFATRQVGILQKLWPFYPERLSQKQNYFYFFLVAKSKFNWFLSGPLCSTGFFHEARGGCFHSFLSSQFCNCPKGNHPF